jgi:hypothetical protein
VKHIFSHDGGFILGPLQTKPKNPGVLPAVPQIPSSRISGDISQKAVYMGNSV